MKRPHLIAKEVATNALLAHSFGLLAAQNAGQCSYRDTNGNPCAIGVSLNDDDAAFMDARPSETTIGHILREGYMTCAPDDVLPLERLQEAHDEWANHVNTYADGEARFLEIAREIAG